MYIRNCQSTNTVSTQIQQAVIFFIFELTVFCCRADELAVQYSVARYEAQ